MFSAAAPRVLLPSSAFLRSIDSPGLPRRVHPLSGFLPSQRFLSPVRLLRRLRQRALVGFAPSGISPRWMVGDAFALLSLPETWPSLETVSILRFRPSLQGFFPSSKSVRFYRHRGLDGGTRRAPPGVLPLWGFLLPPAYPPMSSGPVHYPALRSFQPLRASQAQVGIFLSRDRLPL